MVKLPDRRLSRFDIFCSLPDVDMKLQTIAEIIQARPSAVPDADINWLLTDSRTLTFPSESLFFAIRTKRNDGHKYIPELYKRNVRYFVVDSRPCFEELPDAVFLEVEDTLAALQHLTAVYRAHHPIPVIGITGSNGKTIVKEWLYQLLHTDYNIVRSPRSYNSQIGVPLSVWGLNEDAGLAIFEAGISEPGEMDKLRNIIRPAIGIFTNLGDAHQENFSSLKQKAQEKLKLFKNSEVLIYNKDNRLLDIAVAQAGIKAELFSWGKSPEAVVKLQAVEKSADKTSIRLQYAGAEFSVDIPFTDNASVENALHCTALLLYLGIPAEEIKQRIHRLEPVSMRLEVKEGVRGCIIINDSYSSDINSLDIALDFMNQQASARSMPRTLILSDIVQSGLSPKKLYEKAARLIRNKNTTRFIGIGSEITKHADKFQEIETHFFESTAQFLSSPLIHAFQNEIILLKGSRKFHFEDISSRLEMIAHETVLEVNLNALIDNLNYFRSKIRPETKIMSMVKAFAYGSGSVEVARTLQHHHCDYLAVAVADEGAELRREQIRLPIVVMNPEKGSFGLIFDNNLEPEIYSFRLLESFIASAARLGISNYPIHIKIDSGMHRLGFEPRDMDKLIQLLKNQNQVKVRSVFSHLAGSDEARFDAFTRRQAAVFTACADLFSKNFSHTILRHILNSSGIERFPEYQFDMVRLGIGHYGVSALPGNKLKQVCSLKTVILQIKMVPKGETIGYSRNGIVKRDSRIAVLPIGYADGYDRRFGGGTGKVVINGRRVPIIGNICMDLCMADITDIEAEEGDAVEIFGDNITISEAASWIKTIPYEVLTSVSRRVKRIYFQE